MRVSPQEKQEALERLREWLKPGDTVYTVTRHVTRTGAQRYVGLVLIERDASGYEQVRHPNFSAAEVLGLRVGSVRGRDAIVTRGHGDGLVMDLARILFGSSTALRHEEI